MWTVEESRALLLHMYPNWPDLRGSRKLPLDLDLFRLEFRNANTARQGEGEEGQSEEVKET